MKHISIIFDDVSDPVLLGARSDAITAVHVKDVISLSFFDANSSVMTVNINKSFFQEKKRKIIANRFFFNNESAINTREGLIASSWMDHYMMMYIPSEEFVHDLGIEGVSLSRLPLTQQWRMIRSFSDSVAIPNFYLAKPSEIGTFEKDKKYMRKSVWSLFNWVNETAFRPGEMQRVALFVERPVGMPIIVSYSFNKHVISYPKGKVKFDESLIASIIEACVELFKSRIGEILLYFNSRLGLVFYSFSPYMAYPVGDEYFFLNSFLEEARI